MKAIHKYLVLLLIITCESGCRKYLTIDNPPLGQLTSSTVFKSDASATAALLTVYTYKRILVQFRDLSSSGELADELTNYSLTPNSYYTNAMLPASIDWSDYYHLIYQANAVVDGVTANSSLSPKVVRQLSAEAKFIRACTYFTLTNFWGDIPLFTTTDYKTINLLPRAPKENVYQQIISDLRDAEANLNSNYIDATDTLTTTERTRPTQAAAAALLARVYLYHSEWQNAINEANKVIGNNNYKLLPTLGDVFKANSQEAIWQLQADLSASNGTPESQGFILNAIPAGAKDAISVQLMNSFEANDKRRSSWVGVYTAPTTNVNYYYPAKYKALTGSSEYSTVLRLSEQYLIRAEAEAQLSDLTNATTDLNAIRTRAGLPNTSATTKDAMLNAILKERQVELFAEGHRWFDLKRTGNIDAVMSFVAPLKGGGQWQSYRALLPIPQADLNNDPNLTQNTGY